MTRYCAFLRGINLGKRQVKMAELKACCEDIGLGNVKTLLASGNVLFNAGSSSGLVTKLEAALKQRFGFAIGVVLRSQAELEAMVASEPFGHIPNDADCHRYAILLSEVPDPPIRAVSVAGQIEMPRVDAREVYVVGWRQPNGRYSEGLDQIGKDWDKRVLVTTRNWNTILKAAVA